MKKANQQKPTDPIDKKEEVQRSKDKHINQDFPGFPHPPSQEKTIKEQQSDGSANAFSQSEEEILRGEMDDDNEKTY
jgi:hypothetical protein